MTMVADGMGPISHYGEPLVPCEDRRLASQAGRLFPEQQSMFTEQALLAALLCNPSIFEALPESFGPQHFVVEDHGDIFSVAKGAAASGARMISPIIETQLPHIGGKGGYVRQLVGALVTSRKDDALAYADLLMRLEERRRLAMLADMIRDAAMQAEGVGLPTSAIAVQAMEKLDGLVASQKWSRGAISLGKAMGNAIRIGEEAHKRGDGLAGITTGFPCLNRRLRGFLRGTLHILGARPGMGKTALATQIAIRAALAGNVVLFISLEMEAEQLAQRALALLADVPLDDVLSGAFADPSSPHATAQAGRMIWAQQKAEELTLDIEDEPALTPAAIKMRMKAAERRHGRIDLVIVDHLHITGKTAAAAKHGDNYAITENSAALLAAAKEFNVALLALAQLNRGVEGREDKRPNMADLRASGSIEQDASTITFIYREDYYAARESEEERPGETEAKREERIARLQRIVERTKGKAELICAKVRMGQPGTEHLEFDAPRTRFIDPEDRV